MRNGLVSPSRVFTRDKWRDKALIWRRWDAGGPLASPLRLKVAAADGSPIELVPYGCAKLRVSMFPDDAGKTKR